VLPVRDGLPWLRDAVDSVLQQSFQDFEVIAVDDGSTDGSGDWLRAVGHPRLQVVPGPGEGLARALNCGLARAAGTFIARHDADDWSHPDRLSKQVAFLDAHPDTSVLATCAEYVGPDGEPLDNDWTRTIRTQQDTATTPDALRDLLPLTCGLVHGSIMMRASALRDAGGYSEDHPAAEDYDLWLRLLPSHRFAKLPERLYTHRVHPGQVSGRHAGQQRETTVRAKLEFIRRVCPWLPYPAALALADETRGSAVYRSVGPLVGFDPAPAAGLNVPGGWDVVAVTDFAALDAWAARFEPAIRAGRLVCEGNLFIRTPEAA
jgi:glycosyltransferase involved in cell wall biosynthesis